MWKHSVVLFFILKWNPGKKQKRRREGRKSPTTERQPHTHLEAFPSRYISWHGLLLSTELWHLTGLAIVVCKPFLKKRLNEGLRFIMDLFALKLHPLGKAQAALPQGCLLTDVTSLFCNKRVSSTCYAPGIVRGPGNTAACKTAMVLHQRHFAEMEILLQGFGTSWIGCLQVPPRDAHQPFHPMIFSFWVLDF